MKKTLIALAALAAGTAFAQSTVTLSGGVGVGLQFNPDATGYTAARSKTATAAANSNTALANMGVADSAITFGVVEDLGGGMKAAATINQRFDAPSGAQGAPQGSRFAQNVKLALSGGFGEVAFGRFNGPVDVARGPLDLFNGVDAGAVVYGHASDASTRYNGTVQYTSPSFSGLKVAVAQAFKANNALDTTKVFGTTANMTEAALTYTNGPIYAALGFTKNSGNYDGKDVVTVGAAYDFNVAKVAFTYGKTKEFVVGSDANRWSLLVSAPVGANLILRAGYEQQKIDDTAAAGKVKGWGFGADYLLSKRTKLVANVVTRDSKSTTAADYDGYQTFLGVKHSF